MQEVSVSCNVVAMPMEEVEEEEDKELHAAESALIATLPHSND